MTSDHDIVSGSRGGTTASTMAELIRARIGDGELAKLIIAEARNGLVPALTHLDTANPQAAAKAIERFLRLIDVLADEANRPPSE